MASIYLISPPKIELNSFSTKLENVLKTGLIPAFQLRLKDYPIQEITKIARELQTICQANNCLFLLNDFDKIALEIGAGGVHVGADDQKISEIRKDAPKNFVIGASCYDSRHLAMEAAEKGADYLSFGAFFPTKTKVSRGKPEPEILQWCAEVMNLPVAAIGGITTENCQTLVKAGADFLAVISCIWDCEGKEAEAVKKLYAAISE